MSVLGGIGMISNGVRMARGLLQAAQEHSGKPFSVISEQTIGLELMKQRDQDGDGVLNLAEVGLSREIFERFDVDGDGLLTENEINDGVLALGRERQLKQAIAQYLDLHDSDHDFRISNMESGLDNDIFELLDANEDGFLNRGEITSAYRRNRMDLSG